MANFFEQFDQPASDTERQPDQPVTQNVPQSAGKGTGENFFAQFDAPAEKPTGAAPRNQESDPLKEWANSPTKVDLSDLPQSGQGLTLGQKVDAAGSAVGRGLYGLGTDIAKGTTRGVMGIADRAMGRGPGESDDPTAPSRQQLSSEELGVLMGVSPASAASGKLSAAGSTLDTVGQAAEKFPKGERPAPSPALDEQLIASQAQTRAGPIVQKALKADGYTPDMIDEAADRLEAGLKNGKPLTAADVLLKEKGGVLTQGRNLVNMTKSAATIPGEAANLSGEVAMRGANAADRIGSDFDANVAKNDFYGAKDLVAAGKKAAGPYYDEFYKANPSMQSPTIDRVLATPAGQRALSAVRDDMLNERIKMGVPDAELTDQAIDASMRPEGGVAAGLKAETLDRVKQQLDKVARDSKKALDMGNVNARRDYEGASSLAETLRDEMDRLDVTAKAGPNSFKPEGGQYAQGRKVSAQQFQIDDALEQGRESFNRNLDPEEIQRFMDPGSNSVSAPEQAAFLQGQRRALQDVIDRKAVGKNPITSFTAPAITKKLQASLGEGYGPLEQALNHETQMAKVNGIHIGGSDTMIKNNYGEMIAPTPGTPIRTLGNIVKHPFSSAADVADKFLQGKATAQNQATAGEVMRYMTTNDPNKLRELAASMRPKTGAPRVTINPRPGYYDKPPQQARGGAIHMANGGAVMPRPKSYPAIEKMRSQA